MVYDTLHSTVYMTYILVVVCDAQCTDVGKGEREDESEVNEMWREASFT